MLNKSKHLFIVWLCLVGSLNNVYAGFISTFTYGNNLTFYNKKEDLKADLYKPNFSTSSAPLVILYHGGGYASGDKNMKSIKDFAMLFNNANISAVIPDFRQGWYESESKGLCGSATPETFLDAAHRAYQDCRALIRFCKANASLLGIDSNKIFLFGISSGGFLVMHSLYMNDSSVDIERLARLGSLDNQSNKLTNSTDVAGIISVVGGFYEANPSIIKPYPLLMFNNTCDAAVDFNKGWLGNCSNTARTYGPGIFTSTLEYYHHPYNLHVFCGYNHGFNTLAFPEGGDDQAVNYVIKKSVAFIHQVVEHTFQNGNFTASDSITSVPVYDCKNFETFYWCKDDSATIADETFYVSPNPINCGLQPKLNIRHSKNEVLYVEVLSEMGEIISRQKINYETAQNIIFLNNNNFHIGINILLVKNAEGKILYRTKVMRYCAY
ncbi:MAG: alpha/beta hydrolase [Bacteroidetes bacterium]|nr:alpha/beta hydrolase [Bacteroidota bacterium]